MLMQAESIEQAVHGLSLRGPAVICKTILHRIHPLMAPGTRCWVWDGTNFVPEHDPPPSVGPRWCCVKSADLSRLLPALHTHLGVRGLWYLALPSMFTNWQDIPAEWPVRAQRPIQDGSGVLLLLGKT